MKKAVFASLLSVAALSLCITAAVAQDAAGQVTIKDQAEYNAYTNAEATATPAAYEGFLQAYPNSVVKDAVLEQLMGAYTQTSDYTKATDAADRLLKDQPNNLRALTIDVALKGALAGNATDPAAKQAILDDAAALAQRGLTSSQASVKPIGMAQADWDKQKASGAQYFEGAIAADYDAKKDYADASKAYAAELKAANAVSPAATTTPGPILQDTFNLGLDYYKSTPPDFLDCAYYTARAANYAPEPYKSQMLPTATYCYKKYHGAPAGDTTGTFAQFQAVAAANLFPPANLSTTFTQAPPPPKPEDLAHQAVVSTPDLNTLAIADKEFILGNGTQEDQDKVWAVMKGITAEIPGTVINATADSIQLAVSDDAIQSKTADFTINMATPLKEVPAVGASIKVVGTFDSYTKTPTMIILSAGSIPEEKKAPAKRPVHHTTTH